MSGCELSNGLSRPIDAFIKYFLDVKPYHTKILEVIEQYKFNEAITVQIDETILTRIDIANTPLCHVTGFGIVFDDECGFDAIDCCDLFECLGGYGLIFDNSDLLVNLPIIDLDEDADTITVAGDVTADTRLQIAGINSANTLRVTGDRTAEFTTHNIFFIVHYKTHSVVNTTTTDFIISGDYAAEFFNRKEFRAFNAGANNGVYSVKGVSYDATSDRTSITVASQDAAPLEAGLTGYLEIRSANKNNGAYQVDSVEFTGIETIITINQNNGQSFEYIGETINGSVQFRTGLIPPRRVWISNPDTLVESEYKIVDSTYDPDNDETVLTLAENIDLPGSGLGNVKLYGYMFGAGFDGYEECTIPKPANVHINIGEVLSIILSPGITPTPTPTISLTPTITPTVTVTPTITPTISVTPTITPTQTVTPSVTPTLSVTPSITPTITPTITVTPTVTASVTPSITPTITPTVTVTPSATPGEEGDGPFMLFAGKSEDVEGDEYTPLLKFNLNSETIDGVLADTVEGVPTIPSSRGIAPDFATNKLGWFDTGTFSTYDLENTGLVLADQVASSLTVIHNSDLKNGRLFTCELQPAVLPEYTISVTVRDLVSATQVGITYTNSFEISNFNFNTQLMDDYYIVRARHATNDTRLIFTALSFNESTFSVEDSLTLDGVIPNSAVLIEEILPNAQILKEATFTAGNTTVTTVYYDQTLGFVTDSYDFSGDVPDMEAIYGFAYDPNQDALAISYLATGGVIGVILVTITFSSGVPSIGFIGTPQYFDISRDVSEISYYNNYLGVREANSDRIEVFYFDGTTLDLKDNSTLLTNVGGRWIEKVFNTVYEPDSFAFRAIPNSEGAVDFYGYEDGVTELLSQAPSAPLVPTDGEVYFIFPFQTSPSDNFVTYIVVDTVAETGTMHTYSVNLNNTLTLLSSQTTINGTNVGGNDVFMYQAGTTFYYSKKNFGTGITSLYRYSFNGTQFSEVGTSINLGESVSNFFYSNTFDVIVYAYNDEITNSFLNTITDNGSTFTLGTPTSFDFGDFSPFTSVKLVADVEPLIFLVNSNIQASLIDVESSLTFTIVAEYDYLSDYGIANATAVPDSGSGIVYVVGSNPALISSLETPYITLTGLLWDGVSSTQTTVINLNYQTYQIDTSGTLILLATGAPSDNAPILLVIDMQTPRPTILSINTDSISGSVSSGQIKWFFTNTGA